MNVSSQSSTEWSSIGSIEGKARWIIGRLRDYDLAVFASLLALVSFSLPGRGGEAMTGGIDFIAIAKLFIRFAAFGWFSVIVWLHGKDCQRPTDGWVSPSLLPWFVFLGWAAVTFVWSPLPVVSIGQWFGFAALLLMSQVIALRVNEHNGEVEWPALFSLMFCVLTIYSAVILVVYLFSPAVSGLDRSLSFRGNGGLIHPTAAGATASLGMVWAVSRIARANRGSWLFLSFAVTVHAGLLIAAKSRSSMVMAALSIMFYLAFFYSLRVRACVLLMTGAGCLSLVLIDPGLELVETYAGGVVNYVSRGQSVEQLQGVSGRSEMWEAVWAQYLTAPIFGHGYFVTSSNGMLDVWDGPGNHDAHNVFLQVLVSTGLVGGILFLWALLSTLRRYIESCGWLSTGEGDVRRDVMRFVLVLGIWYAGWTQGCVSFLGPIRPESVVFFVALGVLTGMPDSRRDGNDASYGVGTK